VNEPIQNSKSEIRLPILLAIAVCAGMLIGANMFGGSKNTQLITQGYTKFRDILTHIDQSYVDSVNTEDLIDYSIEKMLEKLDPHTVYIPAKDVEQANMQLEGDFDGIGIEFNIFRDTIIVIAPLAGGPSEAVGLQSGDKIVKVNGELVAGVKAKPDNAKVFQLLRGKRGSKVKLSVKRRGAKNLLDYTVTRDKIPSQSVDVGMMLDDKTGYIKVSRFSASTYQEFKESLQKLKALGMKQLMLDLRDNPGGYMDRAVNMVDELVGGTPKIVYTNGKGTRYDSEYFAHINGLFEKGPVIVLIDEGSASASEIVAGALQDNDRALIVGRRSFGKGLVQMPIDLSDGSELRLTISRYYTPSGRSIQKPYEGGDYENDSFMDRLKKGELFNADSIKVNKKQKYQTLKGRTVYGGGGIMPDVFVPFDSTRFIYLNELYKHNLIREYALNYYNENKATLQKMDYKSFKEKFIVNDKMLNDLIELGRRAGVAYDAQAYENSKKAIQLHLKAFVARGVWKNEGFFPIIFEQDEIFQAAIKLFDKAQKIEKGAF
jgi:carboxyl-terminal processing protease